jgi:hypothetical protein
MATARMHFPLTVTLSPSAGEREKRRSSFDMLEHACFADTWPMILPLPFGRGEGRGEGIETL